MAVGVAEARLHLRLGGHRVPVLLPRVTDPRLHVAAVLVSVQILGQTVLGFDLSIAQILVSLGVCAAIELPMTLWQRGVLAWPASAFLTGNGVALLLRTPGTEHGDWWSLNGWQIFVAAAGVSLLSKYAVVIEGRHLFNPSNFGLVVVFLAFGSDYADPQDLWWGPWDRGLALTVVLIVLGGLSLSWRMKLFSITISFWAVFATAVGLVAARGHAITARWSIEPVEGFDYWWVLVTSPEILIFVFFMITDPRTAPLTTWGRRIYAGGTGALAAVLVSLQTTEFATKVSLLVALTIMCAFRPMLERQVPDAASVSRGRFRHGRRSRVVGWSGAAAVLTTAILLMTTAMVEPPVGRAGSEVAAAVAGGRPSVELPAGSVPEPIVRPEARTIAPGLEVTAPAIARDVVEGLAIEATASRTLTPELVASASFGPRLASTKASIEQAQDSGRPFEVIYEIRSLEIVLLRDSESPQAIPQLGMAAKGSTEFVQYEDLDATRVTSRSSAPLDAIFMIANGGSHYVIGDVLAADDPMVVGDPAGAGGSGSPTDPPPTSPPGQMAPNARPRELTAD